MTGLRAPRVLAMGTKSGASAASLPMGILVHSERSFPGARRFVGVSDVSAVQPRGRSVLPLRR